MNLNELRRQIDDTDDRILKLFLSRMELAGRVAEYKASSGLPVLHKGREEEILNRLAERADEQADCVKALFSTLMDLSRTAQHSLLKNGDALRREVTSALEKAPAPLLKAACAGADGAYASEAAKEMLPGAELLFRPDFGAAFASLENGECDCAVVPIENSLAGSVTEIYDLMFKHRFFIRESLSLPISHSLLGIKGARTDDITTVISHPQALAQCSEFISGNKLNKIAAENTALAAKSAAEKGDVTLAAIASKKAGKLYGLEALTENIQNDKDNFTRFLCIVKELYVPTDANRFSLTFALEHETGSLYRVLSRFAAAGINLTKLESRPMRGRSFEYQFYLDCEGSIRTEKNLDLLCALSEELPEFRFLGNYAIC